MQPLKGTNETMPAGNGSRQPLKGMHSAVNDRPGLHEFLSFIRLNICLSVTALAATGYLLFSRPDGLLAYVALSAFSGCAAAYAYNNITDVREDLINRKKTNYFAGKPAGKWTVALLALLGLYFSFRLPTASTLTYISFTTILITYSSLRIKERFLLKNIWTAVGITQGFLMGALVFAQSAAILQSYVPVFLLFLVGSIVADMRDVEGDRKTGINTLPVKLGIAHSVQIVYVLALGAVAAIIASGPIALYIPMLFVPAALFLLSKGRYAAAHTTGGVSFGTLLAWQLVYWGL